MAWIELDGAVNVRDLGGLPAGSGQTRPGRLIRADNLQDLSERDVALLVTDLGVRRVADLRTTPEVEAEGPGPLVKEPAVDISHLSLYPEAGEHTDVLAAGAPQLPWHRRDESFKVQTAAQIYTRYLSHRPESIVVALRLIARPDGATIVHCAAGKDRTGVVVALALAAVGVERDAIVADYVLTNERLAAIFARLGKTPTYAHDLANIPPDYQVRPENIAGMLRAVDADYGGPVAWLRSHGWTDTDQVALESALLG